MDQGNLNQCYDQNFQIDKMFSYYYIKLIEMVIVIKSKQQIKMIKIIKSN